MKKRIMALLMVLALAITGAAFLTACGNKEKNISVGITLKVADWEDGYDYVSSVDMRVDSFGAGGNFESEDTLGIPSSQTRAGVTYTCTVTYKTGYNPASVTVTESSGKAFKLRVGSESGGDAGRIYIDITPTADADYEFVLSRPSAIIREVGFSDLSTELLNSTAPAVKDFLDAAQIYVGGKFESIRQLSGKTVQMDMSKEDFYVYAKFDADAKRVIFNDDYKKFISMYYNYSLYVDYCQIPGTTQYAYSYKFFTSYLQETFVIDLDEEIIKNLAYRDCEFDTNIYAPVSFEKGITLQLKSYTVDGKTVEITTNGQIKKEYGKSYTLVYETTNPAPYDNVNKAEIKFTVNGKQVATAYDGVSDTYSITIGETELPVDYYTTAQGIIDKFEIGIDVKTVKPASGNTVSITSEIVPTEDPDIREDSGKIITGAKFAEQITDGDSYFMYATGEVIDTTTVNFDMPYSQFKLKVTVDGTAYASNVLKAGIDYFTTVDESGYKMINKTTENVIFLLGDESSDKYVYVKLYNGHRYGPTHYNGGQFDVVVRNGSAQHTDIKISVSDAVYRTATVKFDSSVQDGRILQNDEVVEDNVITLNELYDIQTIVDNLEDGDNIYYELYSNGKLIATLKDGANTVLLPDDLKSAGFEVATTFGIVMNISSCSSHKDKFLAEGRVCFGDGNKIWFELTGGENYYLVPIDEIVVKL